MGDLWGLPMTRTAASNLDLVLSGHSRPSVPSEIPRHVICAQSLYEALCKRHSRHSSQPWGEWELRDRLVLEEPPST